MILARGRSMGARRESKVSTLLPGVPVAVLGVMMAASSLQASCDNGDGLGASEEPDGSGDVVSPDAESSPDGPEEIDAPSEDSAEDRADGMSYGDGYGVPTDAATDAACVSSTTTYPPATGCPAGDHLWACWPPTPASGGIPVSHYQIATLCGEGVVVDTNTHLMWARNTQPGDYDWVTAAASCKASRRAGFSDWRLPSSNELMSLVDYANPKSILDPAVFNGAGGNAWTATVFVQQAGQAWQVYASGGIYPMPVSTPGIVRCVR